MTLVIRKACTPSLEPSVFSPSAVTEVLKLQVSGGFEALCGPGTKWRRWQFNKNTCSLCERIFEDHTWVLNWDWGQRVGINCKLSETVKFKNRVESCTIMRIYPTIEWKVSHHIWKISTAFFFSFQREDDHILNISKYRSQHFDLHKRKSIYKPARLLRHCYERLWTFWQDDRSWAWKLSGLQGNHSFINFFRSS